MMRNRISGSKAVLLLALFLGLISAVLVYVYLGQAGGKETAASGDTKQVLVAKDDIPVATRITDSMVELKAVSEDAVLPDSFSSTEGVVGNMARYPIAAGEQILSDRVASSSMTLPEGGELPLPYMVPEGKRAVSVTTSDVIGAGGLMRPGDYVDVILTVKTQPGDQIARTVLQNLEVLALDQEMEKAVPKVEDGQEAQTAAAEGETNPKAVTVTLAVTPLEGEVLTTAEVCSKNFGGRLALALRPFGEHDAIEGRSTWSETGSTPVCSQLFAMGLADLSGEQGGSQSPVAP